jgi:hypothetical protein
MNSISANRETIAKRRQILAREAARILAQTQSGDYQSAKQKALRNLGLPAKTPLPRNQEIEAALFEHQQLFGDTQVRQHLIELRRSALVAMRELHLFKPRLTGPVLRGSANPNSTVQLHLFAETIEDVGFFLQDQSIPYRHIEQRFNTGSGKKHSIPGYGLVADGVAFDLLVFSGSDRHLRPQCPFEGGTMRRASANEVQLLLNSESEGL